MNKRRTGQWSSFYRWESFHQLTGLRGEVKVFPTTDDAARFQTLKEVILDTGKEKLDLEIQSVRFLSSL